MAVAGVWDVEHSCGHEQNHDLGDKRVSERAGFAKWLATKECSDCWRAHRDKENGKEREAWLADRRASELAEIEAWETRSDMGPLDGSEKSISWGRRVRHELLAKVYEDFDDDNAYSADIEDPARTVTKASWWIDQKDSDPADMAELLADAASDPKAGVNENPY